MRAIMAIHKKQWKETMKNKEVLIQFILFPIMAFIMTHSVQIPGMPEQFFVTLFASMYVGMAPLTSMTSIIAEEKEKNTLGILKMSNVSPWQYLISVGGYILLVCLLGAFAFGLIGKYNGGELLLFVLIMASGTLISTMIGAVIGLTSRSQMSASAAVVPVMMIISFVPMISTFNETFKKMANYLYSQQIHLMLDGIGCQSIESKGVLIIAMNVIIVVILVGVIYNRVKKI